MSDQTPREPEDQENAAQATGDDAVQPGGVPSYAPTDPAAYTAPPHPSGYGPAQGETPMTARAAQLPGDRTSKGRTIGLIVAGVIAAGVLGALAGLVLGGEADGTRPTSPVSPTDRAEGVLSGAPAVTDPTAATRGRGSVVEGALDPEPSQAAAAGTDSSAPTGDLQADPDTGAGEFASLQPGVGVFVPDGWEVVGQDDTQLLQTSGSTFVYTATGSADPASEASATILELAPDLIPASTYTQLESSEITPSEPQGAIVSLAFVDYVAVYADAQSAVPIYGRMIVAIRQDGVLLAMTIESSPPEAFNDEQPDWSSIPAETLGAFAGL